MKTTMSKKTTRSRTQKSETEDGKALLSEKVWIMPQSPKSMVRTTTVTRWEPDAKPLQWSSSLSQLYGYNFAFNNVAGYTELQSSYDYYRITRVDIIYYPQNRLGPPVGTSVAPAVIWLTPDWSNTSVGSLDEIRQHELALVKPAAETWEISIVPRYSQAVYSGGVLDGYSMAPRGWVHTESAGVQYYGLKLGLPQVPSANLQLGSMYFRYHIELMVGK